MCQFLTRSVGIVVPLVRFVGMGMHALTPTLVSLTPVATMAAKAIEVASLVEKVVLKVAQHVACLTPAWWTSLKCHPSQTPRLVQHTLHVSISSV